MECVRALLKGLPTVIKRLAGRFKDRNERAPHKGLRLLSPREFILFSWIAECPAS